MSGEVNYPNVVFEPSNIIQFNNLNENVTAEKQIIIRNISPILTDYRFAWNIDAYEEIDISTTCVSITFARENHVCNYIILRRSSKKNRLSTNQFPMRNCNAKILKKKANLIAKTFLLI